ncbi:MAG: Holliday junction branch migration protein RuvA [Candidatus Scalindua sp.]|jgi:Holliday junction DNA helicase RuvA|nr:Holliday junction branch migration protein RuvA [Candidatus Scalindua sp.]MBT5305090.1 Holliday junction branch migration protein RuvA [Candidatus Scalindua sp.]MBT6046566.1 Holliday junction branch migration protein RuvA [Candidatus Scalindua sp.]MBT6562239.1 Holliday junction branch migration protein RuvA [Candidatus Scalindua sp.]MBT7211652.1 Holliday junction branch migration protein RuvA [Candidatus Scalindua sp.]
MFDFIYGNIAHKTPTTATIETNGIGYKIHIPLSTFEKISNKESTKLFTKLTIRDDEIKIYGFFSLEERNLFNLLLSVNGVGSNVALTILSSSSISQFGSYVVSNDSKSLQRIKGIGKKTSERIILELKETIKCILPDSKSSTDTKNTAIISDAVMAMISLGYAKPEAEKAVNKASDNVDPTEGIEVLIKEALSCV